MTDITSTTALAGLGRRRARDLIKRLLPLAMIALLFAAMAAYVAAFGVDAPFWDEWELGKFYEAFARGKLSFGELLAAKHNEHLIGVSFLFMLMHHLATGFDVKAILFTGLLLQTISLLVLLALARPLFSEDRAGNWQRLVVALLLLSFAPYTNILWGFQTAWYLVTLLLMFTLVALRRALLAGSGSGLGAVVVGALFALAASLSSVQGLAVWVAGTVFLLAGLEGPLGRALTDRRLLTWVIAATLGVAVYAILSALSPVPGATGLGAALRSLTDPVGLIKFWLLAFGTVAGAVPPRWGFAAGALLSVLTIGAAFTALRATDRRSFALPLALVAFGITFVLLIAVGRLPLGVGAARESRYAAYVLLAIAGAYLIVARGTVDGRPVPAIALLRTLLVGATVAAFVSSAYFALVHGHEWRMERGISAVVLLDYQRQPDFVIERTLYGNAGMVVAQANFLARTRQTVFAAGEAGVPAVARPYMRPTPQFQELMDKHPEDAAALMRLWQSYLAGPDVRQVLQYSSRTFPFDLVRWASGSSRDGGHYLSPFLAPYGDRYVALKDALERSPKGN